MFCRISERLVSKFVGILIVQVWWNLFHPRLFGIVRFSISIFISLLYWILQTYHEHPWTSMNNKKHAKPQFSQNTPFSRFSRGWFSTTTSAGRISLSIFQRQSLTWEWIHHGDAKKWRYHPRMKSWAFLGYLRDEKSKPQIYQGMSSSTKPLYLEDHVRMK